ncbi:Hypothetical predicted protein [Podarcis lilfordi]|uniref:Uncharacterized protein n=1 Tax=Podarcis lilfordi TaxID=74358 RepID=A0AA35KVW4_9SAUR|nr:Hypothetical predicted protein [Podarcis lilfordi]
MGVHCNTKADYLNYKSSWKGTLNANKFKYQVVTKQINSLLLQSGKEVVRGSGKTDVTAKKVTTKSKARLCESMFKRPGTSARGIALDMMVAMDIQPKMDFVIHSGSHILLQGPVTSLCFQIDPQASCIKRQQNFHVTKPEENWKVTRRDSTLPKRPPGSVTQCPNATVCIKKLEAKGT